MHQGRGTTTSRGELGLRMTPLRFVSAAPHASSSSLPPLGSDGDDAVTTSPTQRRFSVPPLTSGAWKSRPLSGKATELGDETMETSQHHDDDDDVHSSRFSSPPSFLKATLSAQRTTPSTSSSYPRTSVGGSSGATTRLHFASCDATGVSPIAYEDDHHLQMPQQHEASPNVAATCLASDDMEFARFGGADDFTVRTDERIAPLHGELHGRTPQPHRTDRGGAYSSTPPPAPSSGGFTAVSHVKELAAKYFTIIRQSQLDEKNDQSFDGGNDTDRPTSNSHTTPLRKPKTSIVGSPSPRQAPGQQHPQQHLISREFELCTDDVHVDRTRGGTNEEPMFVVRECYLRRRLSSSKINDSSCSAGNSAVDVTLSDETTTDDGSSPHSPGLGGTAVPRKKTLHFSAQQEISSIVNMADVALCRLIDVRTQFSVEREAHAHFLRATAATCNTLPAQIQLTMPSRITLRNTVQNLQEDSIPMPPTLDFLTMEKDGEQLSHVLAQLETTLREQQANNTEEDANAAASVGKALALLKSVAAELRPGESLPDAAPHTMRTIWASVSTILASLMAEVGVKDSGAASLTANDPNGGFDFDAAMDDITAHQNHEEAYKHAGNLSLGAAARRELLQRVHRYVESCAGAIEQCRHGGNNHVTALETARAATDSLLDSERERLARSLAHEKQNLAKCSDNVQRADAVLRTVQTARNDAIVRQHRLLAANDAEVQRTLRQIDDLYGTLETLINTRSAGLKDYSKELARICCHELEAEEALKRATSVHDAVRKSTMPEARYNDVSLVMSAHIPKLLEATRSTQASLLEMRAAELMDRQAALQDYGVRLAVLQRQSVSQWVDVLMRNQVREEERSAMLQGQIRDAASRYHQEDVDLFRGQLDEAMERHRKIELEMSQLEEMVRNDERLLSKCIPNFVTLSTAAAATYSSHPQHFEPNHTTASSSFYHQHNSSFMSGGGSRPQSGASPGSPQSVARGAGGRLGNAGLTSPVRQQPLSTTSHHHDPMASPAPHNHCMMPHVLSPPPSAAVHQPHLHNTSSTGGGWRTPLKQTMSQPSPMHEFVQSPMQLPSGSAGWISGGARGLGGTLAKEHRSSSRPPVGLDRQATSPSPAPRSPPPPAYGRQPLPQHQAMCLVLVDEEDGTPPPQHHAQPRRRARAESRPMRADDDNYEITLHLREKSYGASSEEMDDTPLEAEQDAEVLLPGEEHDSSLSQRRWSPALQRRIRQEARNDSPEPVRPHHPVVESIDPPSPVPQRSQSLARCQSDLSNASADISPPACLEFETLAPPLQCSTTGIFVSDSNAAFRQHERTLSGGGDFADSSYNDPLGDGDKEDDDEDGTELVDVDELSVEEIVSLFHRSASLSNKWVAVLREADVETMKDIQVLRMSHGVWSSFLQHHPLLKSMLETLLDNPRHFVTSEE